MTSSHDDRDLQQLLAEDGGEWGTLYRKLSRVEPPRRLDRNVLGEAARAVQGKLPRRQRWLLGLGSAAGLVLAAGVAWHVGHDALRHPLPPAFNPPAADGAHSRYVPVDAIHVSPSPQSVSPAEKQEVAPAPPAAVARSAAARPQPPTPSRAPAPAPAAPPPAAAVPAAPSAATTTAPMDREMPVLKQAAAPAESFVPEAESTAAPPREERARAAPSRRNGAATELNHSSEVRNDAFLPPDAWIRRIRWLLEQGREQQARESLQLLLRTHPQVQLPADLKALQ